MPTRGRKSKSFCRQTRILLAANPQIVPPNLGLAEAPADLAALDQLRPRPLQLRQLAERADDTEMALGSDIIGVVMVGYGMLKMSDKGEALKGARKELSARFATSPRAPQRGTLQRDAPRCLPRALFASLSLTGEAHQPHPSGFFGCWMRLFA